VQAGDGGKRVVQDRRAAVQGVGRGEGRDGAGLAGERHQQRGAADEAAEGVHDRATGEAQGRDRRLVAHRVGRDGRAIDDRRLGDRRRQIRVARRDREDVAARRGEAPDRKSEGVDSRQGAGEVDRRLQVSVLLADRGDLPRLAPLSPKWR